MWWCCFVKILTFCMAGGFSFTIEAMVEVGCFLKGKRLFAVFPGKLGGATLAPGAVLKDF